MKLFILVYLILVCLFFGGLYLCVFFLERFPNSKITDFIRRHIIDENDDHE